MTAGTAAADPIHDEGLALGRALKVLRARSGLSQQEAGRRFGVSGQAWGLYENGRAASIFHPAVQRRLADALGVTVADLQAERARLSEAQP